MSSLTTVSCGCVDLRRVTVGQGAAEKGHTRTTGFDITGQ